MRVEVDLIRPPQIGGVIGQWRYIETLDIDDRLYDSRASVAVVYEPFEANWPNTIPGLLRQVTE